jgi:hypothetical protein
MANTFDEELVATAAEFSSTFGETVTYYPAAGGSREIEAVVNRRPPAELDGPPHGVGPEIEIAVANDATTGISSSEINKMKDQVKLAVRIGQTAEKRLVTEIISQDAGMMTLELG